ncbi:MAG: RNA pyrophosphohydrolase [Campylobacterota bacterium]|nr:RNA pyrophosphohydrolase [Campylobacterota bacterium]
MSKKKLYRRNVAAIIVSSDYPKNKEIFIAERNDMENVWQFPQGGIDDGEKAKEALFRELKEEIGTNKIEVIAKYPGWLRYEFPEGSAKKMKPFIGQKQRYYLVRLKKKAKINLDTKHPEFMSYKFVPSEKVMSYMNHFKKPLYKEAIKYFRKKGYL